MNAKMQQSSGLTGEGLLNLLLDRFETPRQRARDITQAIDYTRVGGPAAQDEFHRVLHDAERAGGIVLERARLGRFTGEFARARLVDADKLYGFLVRSPAGEIADVASRRIGETIPDVLKDPFFAEVEREAIAAWRSNKSYLGLSPTQADTFSTVMRLADGIIHLTGRDVDHRTFSRRTVKDSKALERSEGRIAQLLKRRNAGLAGDEPRETLEASGIVRRAHLLQVKGPLRLSSDALTIEGTGEMFIGLPWAAAQQATLMKPVDYIITIENPTSFWRYCTEIAKWRKRSSVADLPTGPKEPKSTVLSIEDEAIVVAFRRYTLLPLDDCLYALQATLPHLTRSSLHRCLQRHGISRLPAVKGDKPDKRKFKTYPIGYFHIDIAEVRTQQGRLYLFVAIDRTSKFAFVELHEKATMRVASDFLQALIKAVPYRIHTVLTDNGIQFADLPKNRSKPTAMWRGHPFDRACRQHSIEHRLTKPNHPWTNGQVERMNRTLKEATVQRYYYETHEQLRRHLVDFVMAYNFARRLKTLLGLTPYEYICKTWSKEPDRFTLDPAHQMPGLNT